MLSASPVILSEGEDPLWGRARCFALSKVTSPDHSEERSDEESACEGQQKIGAGRIEWSRSPLPPNRTGGFPASGSPVGGFTSKRSDERSSVAKEKAPRDRRDNAHPAYRVLTLRINPGQRARLRRRRVELSGGLAPRPWLRRSALTPIVSHPPSCAPFPPGPLRPLVALMGALTPARSVAPVLGLSPATSRRCAQDDISRLLSFWAKCSGAKNLVFGSKSKEASKLCGR